MAKQEKILWGFFAGILVFLYLLSSTDLIIKEKKTEIYPVSIVIGDTTDDYYVNFRDAQQGGREPAVTHRQMLAVMRVIDAIFVSAKEHRAVKPEE